MTSIWRRGTCAMCVTAAPLSSTRGRMIPPPSLSSPANGAGAPPRPDANMGRKTLRRHASGSGFVRRWVVLSRRMSLHLRWMVAVPGCCNGSVRAPRCAKIWGCPGLEIDSPPPGGRVANVVELIKRRLRRHDGGGGQSARLTGMGPFGRGGRRLGYPPLVTDRATHPASLAGSFRPPAHADRRRRR
jgi:hypothetical protein